MSSVLNNYLSGTQDPTASATYGAIGQLYVRLGTPNVYQKITSTGNNTAWQLVGTNSSFLPATSSIKTPPGNALFLQLTGNSVTLTPGNWMINGSIFWDSAANCLYTACGHVWASTNGTDTGSGPTTATVSAGHANFSNYNVLTTGGEDRPVNTIRKTVAVNTTIFLVPFIQAGAPTDARISTYIYAEQV